SSRRYGNEGAGPSQAARRQCHVRQAVPQSWRRPAHHRRPALGNCRQLVEFPTDSTPALTKQFPFRPPPRHGLKPCPCGGGGHRPFAGQGRSPCLPSRRRHTTPIPQTATSPTEATRSIATSGPTKSAAKPISS